MAFSGVQEALVGIKGLQAGQRLFRKGYHSARKCWQLLWAFRGASGDFMRCGIQAFADGFKAFSRGNCGLPREHGGSFKGVTRRLRGFQTVAGLRVPV